MATEHAELPPPPTRLSYADALGIFLLFVLFLTVSYFQSRHRMFWGDEIMGWLVLKQPTWHDQLTLWKTGFDSSGLWFHVLGRPWIAVFGASEVSLREFSALFVAASAAVLWITARRFYSLLPVACTIPFVYFGMKDVAWQLANGRTYGLFLLGAACVLYVVIRGEASDTTRPSPLFLLGTFAAYSLLVGSHTLGGVYAAMFLGIQWALDLRSHRFRPLLYLSAIASFSVMAFSLSNILGTIATGKPSYWTLRPTLRDFLLPNVAFGGKSVGTMALLLLIIVLFTNRHRIHKRMPIYLILLGFLALDTFFYLASLRLTSIYVNRYLMPMAMAGVLLLCELLTLIRESEIPRPRLNAALPAMILVYAACLLFVPQMNKPLYPWPNYTGNLIAQLPPGLPVVDTDIASFREVLFYHHGDIDRPFVVPVDWEVALDPDTAGGVSGSHEMDRFKEQHIYDDDIQPTAQILARYHRFLVLTSTPSSVWMRKRILSNPRYTVQRVGTFSEDATKLNIWLVHD